MSHGRAVPLKEAFRRDNPHFQVDELVKFLDLLPAGHGSGIVVRGGARLGVGRYLSRLIGRKAATEGAEAAAKVTAREASEIAAREAAEAAARKGTADLTRRGLGYAAVGAGAGVGALAFGSLAGRGLESAGDAAGDALDDVGEGLGDALEGLLASVGDGVKKAAVPVLATGAVVLAGVIAYNVAKKG